MKTLIYIIIFSLFSGSIHAQTLPKFPEKKDTTKTTKPTSPKPKKNFEEKIASATMKFLRDADGILFIDGEYKGELKKNIPLRVNLSIMD